MLVVEAQVEMQIGMAAHEIAKARHQPDRTERHWRRDDQLALRRFLLVLEGSVRRHGSRGHVRGGAKQRVAAIGQHQSARMALEQRYAQLFLQRCDLAGDRRLRNAKALAGERQAAGFGGGVK